MGTKKQGQKILTGSLKTHWMMYVNYVNIQVNPTDKVGVSNSVYMLNMLIKLNSKFLQPGFEY